LPPYYPLKSVKQLLTANHFEISDPALSDAHYHFHWGPSEIIACLMSLNDRDYVKNMAKNHYYKTEPHRKIPNTKMDYYKMQNAPGGFEVYTHFYIRDFDGKLMITSFKEL
jgi:hypothetical protein